MSRNGGYPDGASSAGSMFAIVTIANSAKIPITITTITLCARATSVEPATFTIIMTSTIRPANTFAQTDAVVREHLTGITAERHRHHRGHDGVHRIRHPGRDAGEMPVAEATTDVFQQTCPRRDSGTQFGERVPLETAMIPARTKESQTADPATSPAAPRREKIPAPTMAATPMNAACGHEMYFFACAGPESVKAPPSLTSRPTEVSEDYSTATRASVLRRLPRVRSDMTYSGDPRARDPARIR